MERGLEKKGEIRKECMYVRPGCLFLPFSTSPPLHRSSLSLSVNQPTRSIREMRKEGEKTGRGGGGEMEIGDRE